MEQRRRKKFNRGKWEVERERHRLEAPAPANEYTSPDSLARSLPQIMKRLGLEADHWLDVLQAEWPNIVGEGVAKHTCPGRFEKKRLTVFVDSSTWLNELSRYGQKEMLANIQARFGKDKIGFVYLQLDPEGGRRRGRGGMSSA